VYNRGLWVDGNGIVSVGVENSNNDQGTNYDKGT